MNSRGTNTSGDLPTPELENIVVLPDCDGTPRSEVTLVGYGPLILSAWDVFRYKRFQKHCIERLLVVFPRVRGSVWLSHVISVLRLSKDGEIRRGRGVQP